MPTAVGFAAETFLTEVLGATNIRVKGDEITHACLLMSHENDHREPGASLNAEKLLYNCWKCGSGGTLIWLTEEVLQVSSSKARALLKEYFDSDEVHEDTFLQSTEAWWAASAMETMPRYNMAMVESRMCYTKLMDERGISHDVQRRMKTGLNLMNTDEATLDDGSTVQVVQPRIMIPHIFGGVLRGWTQRKIDDRQIGRKYKHTSQFPKRFTLYNYDLAKTFDSVIVVESPFSVLKLMSEGYDNVVATFGAEVNPVQEDQLAKWNEVTLFPDGDGAGYRALCREDKWGNRQGLTVSLGSRTNVWIVDHGRLDDPPDWNGLDAADYSAEELTDLFANRVKAIPWDFCYPYERPNAEDEQWD